MTIEYLSGKVGEHLTSHLFRHLHATHLLRQKIAPRAVQERMGHSSLQTALQGYQHVVDEMKDEAAQAAGNILSWER